MANSSGRLGLMKNMLWYKVPAGITFVLVLIATELYAFASWGFLLGIVFGWIPSLVAATIAAFIWPLLALVLVVFLVMAFPSESGEVFWSILGLLFLVGVLKGLYQAYMDVNQKWNHDKIFRVLVSVLLLTFLTFFVTVIYYTTKS